MGRNAMLASHLLDQLIENIEDLLAMGDTIETILPRLGVTADRVDKVYSRRGLLSPCAKWHKTDGDAA